MSVCEHLEASGFYHTALDSLMDSLFISSTPYFEPQRHCHSRIKKTQTLDDDQLFFSSCSSTKQSPSTPKKGDVTKIDPSAEAGKELTPKRTVLSARKQKLFVEPEDPTEEFRPRTRTTASSGRELSPETKLLRKAVIRMECLQRRQARIELSKKPMRTSLRV